MVQRQLIIATISIIGPVGLLINTIIIWTLFKSRLYRTRNYLIYASLALCDGFNATFGCVFGVCIYMIGEFSFCKGVLVTTVLSYTTSVAVVSFLSYDRYLMLRRPLHYPRIMTRRFMIIVIVTIWAVSLLNAGLLLSRQAVLPITDHISTLNRKNCVLTRIVAREYLIAWSVLLILLPMLTTIFMNVAILRLATSHYKTLQRATASFRCAPNREWNIKAAFTTVRIVTTNVLCTLPFVCVVMIESLCSYCVPYKTMRPFYTLFVLNFASTIVNPLVYTITNQELKRKVKKTLLDVSPLFIKRCLATPIIENKSNLSMMASRRSITFELAAIR